MTIHSGAKPGEIADVVLMPGDPYRAKWAAENFLKDARLVNETRGMLGFTGAWGAIEDEIAPPCRCQYGSKLR